MTFHKKQPWISLVFVLPFAGLLLIHAWHYLPFVCDDALISLRYVSRMLAGKGLTWTDGRPVEGYSNLLWILLIAVPGLLRVDLIHAARALGVLGMCAIMFLLPYTYLRAQPIRIIWFPLTVALLFLAAGAPIAVWAIGGLEQPLYGALIAASIPLMYAVLERPGGGRRSVFALSLVLGLLCLTRPDGPLFAAAAAAALLLAGLLCARRGSLADAAAVLVGPVLFFAAQLAFRFLYYGELVPNTALVKLAPSMVHAAGGWRYLSGGFKTLSPLSVLAVASLVALLVERRTRARGIYLSVVAVFWSAYVVLIGGDIFPAYRHLVPLMVVFAFALVDGLTMVCILVGSRPMYRYALVVFGLALFIPYVSAQLHDKQSQRAVRERWEWQGRDLAVTLRSAFFRQRPLMAVTAAGCLPYWSEFPSLDMLGLSDYYIPRHPPPDIGQGSLGHELGDGQYVLMSEPDLIVFNVGTEPAYRSGEQLARMPEFHERYVPVSVRPKGSDDAFLVYAYKYSRKIGISTSPSAITVPGFLLQGKGAVAYLDSMNRLVVSLTGREPLHVTFDADVRQHWDVEVDATNAAAIATDVSQADRTVSITLRSTSPDPIEVRAVIARPAATTGSVWYPAGPSWLRPAGVYRPLATLLPVACPFSGSPFQPCS
jgi:arabinofuranosyltransferase